MFKVNFMWPDENNQKVELCGSWNWDDKIQMKRESFQWIAKIKLNSGNYQFKFIVDGRYRDLIWYDNCDDGYGGRNNMISIPDFSKFLESQTFNVCKKHLEKDSVISIRNSLRCSCRVIDDFVFGKDEDGSCYFAGIGLGKAFNSKIKFVYDYKNILPFVKDILDYIENCGHKSHIRWLNFSQIDDEFKFNDESSRLILQYLQKSNNYLYSINLGDTYQCDKQIIEQIEECLRDNDTNPSKAKQRVEKL